jgi:oligopeptide/dipeptide ABC transporter ATP-binding protein
VSQPLVELRDVSKSFDAGGAPWQRRHVRAVEGINLDVRPGETLGIVGESGSGKSTLCRVILGLTRPTTGSVVFDGQDLARLSRTQMRRTRRRMQAVFQDSSSAFNPRHTVRSSLLAPLEVHDVGEHSSRQRLVEETLHQVGLDSSFLNRHPHALSGGERQRVAIARAIILRPALVVADEPTSALDVSVQARILNLFRDIQSQLSLTYVFVSHNLGIIRYISDRVAVMYLGEIVEVGPIDEVFSAPGHPYTRALMKAIPQADLSRRNRNPPVLGELPSAYEPPSGCRFHTRCPVVIEGTCSKEHPRLYEVAPAHWAACLWHDPRFVAGAPEWLARPEPAAGRAIQAGESRLGEPAEEPLQ